MRTKTIIQAMLICILVLLIGTPEVKAAGGLQEPSNPLIKFRECYNPDLSEEDWKECSTFPEPDGDGYSKSSWFVIVPSWVGGDGVEGTDETYKIYMKEADCVLEEKAGNYQDITFKDGDPRDGGDLRLTIVEDADIKDSKRIESQDYLSGYLRNFFLRFCTCYYWQVEVTDSTGEIVKRSPVWKVKTRGIAITSPYSKRYEDHPEVVMTKPLLITWRMCEDERYPYNPEEDMIKITLSQYSWKNPDVEHTCKTRPEYFEIAAVPAKNVAEGQASHTWDDDLKVYTGSYLWNPSEKLINAYSDDTNSYTVNPSDDNKIRIHTLKPVGDQETEVDDVAYEYNGSYGSRVFSLVADTDGDGTPDYDDNCPDTPNPDQTNSDTDSHGDACDNCVPYSNESQADSDGNGIGDRCEVTIDPPPDRQCELSVNQESDVATPGASVEFDVATVCGMNTLRYGREYVWETDPQSSIGSALIVTSSGGNSYEASYVAGTSCVPVTETIKVTDVVYNISATATVTVTPTACEITLSPTTETVKSGESIEFSAITACDGNEVSATYSWEVSSSIDSTISATGVYMAGPTTSDATDTITVTDRASCDIIATAVVTVTELEPPLPEEFDVTITPGDKIVASNGEIRFTAVTVNSLTSSSLKQPSPPDYAWSLESEIGSQIDSSTGVYTSGTNTIGHQVLDVITVLDHANNDTPKSVEVLVTYGTIMSIADFKFWPIPFNTPPTILASRWLGGYFVGILFGENLNTTEKTVLRFEPDDDIGELFGPWQIVLGDIIIFGIPIVPNPATDEINIIVDTDGEFAVSNVLRLTIALLPWGLDVENNPVDAQ